MPNSAFPGPRHDQSRAEGTQQNSIPIFAAEIAYRRARRGLVRPGRPPRGRRRPGIDSVSSRTESMYAGMADPAAERRTRMPVLLSVNVGLPRDVPWQGKTVYTGIWKQPVDGPAMVRRLNIDGDGQGDLGGHGGEQRAVLVYQIESYRHWQRHFGRDDLSYGNFGENLTVDGLADADVCIGDRYRIGAAEFEVTQPRVTCYRVGLRLGEPRLPGAAGQSPSPRLLHAGHHRRPDRGRQRDRQDQDRPARADRDRRRRAALPAGEGPGQAAPGGPHPGAEPRLAAIIP